VEIARIPVIRNVPEPRPAASDSKFVCVELIVCVHIMTVVNGTRPISPAKHTDPVRMIALMLLSEFRKSAPSAPCCSWGLDASSWLGINQRENKSVSTGESVILNGLVQDVAAETVEAATRQKERAARPAQNRDV